VTSTVKRIDADTKDWVVDASDDRAARAGAVMDLEAAAHVIDWVQATCCLYEGEGAGELIRLMPYQVDYLTRLFGWKIWSKDWGRWVRRFTQFGGWYSKKNGKSPLLACMGLYLLTADGEPGQKVYMAAKNGEQARIAQRHAFQMVKASPALDEECNTYLNTLAIYHLPTNSSMTVLTGDDQRGQKAKEGLNGSVLIDEAHVVDRAMMLRVTRAGISRRQPLLGSLSTAGDDPSSWGYERFRYGRQVALGERFDDRYLHVEYSAPDGVTEAQLAEDPVRYGRMANPAWGAIVKEGEFVEDFRRCLGDAREMSKFLQYRVNKWVGSTNRWLDVGGWVKGRRKITPRHLAGREVFVAVDLARKLDMAAVSLVAACPEEGEEAVVVWPMFWMPEDTARAQDLLFPFVSWAAAGHLKLTKGGVIDFARIKADVRKVVRDYGLEVAGLYYDQKYAEEFTQQLCEGEFNPHTNAVLEEGLGCDRFEFDQTITALTGPSCEVERRVKAGLVIHPGNPVLDWQVGHCEVKTDVNQNIRPVKPDPSTGKKIDGVITMVMGVYGVTAKEDAAPRVY
jgi:phage terminase large subunit-like protein